MAEKLVMEPQLRSRKTNFFVDTAQGSYCINLLGGVSVSVAGVFFTKFVHPAVKRKYAAARNNTPSTTIARRPGDLQLQIEHRRQVSSYLSQELYGPRRPLGPRNNWLLPSHINDVTIIVNMRDNVSDEAVQNSMRNLHIRRHHLSMPTPPRVILLRGSKLIRVRFDIRLLNSEDQLTLQAEELEHLAEEAMNLDENATLQVGGLTIIHKDDQGQLTMSILPETDVPIISSVTHFPWRPELMIEGCFLSGCEFKASTASQCTNLRVSEEVKKLEDGVREVVYARAPKANELLLDDHTYIYAYKSVLCGEKPVIVRSEGIQLIKTSPQSSIIDELRKSDTIGTIVILFVMFNMLGIAPASSFIVRFSLQLIIIAIGYLLTMRLLGPWFVRWLTSKGASDGGPAANYKGMVMERSPGVADKGKGIKGRAIERGTITRRVMKSFLEKNLKFKGNPRV